VKAGNKIKVEYEVCTFEMFNGFMYNIL